MDRARVPRTTIQRLPVYLRALLQAQEEHRPVINSVDIAEMCGTNAAQVRKDFSYLGELGTRGIGYDVESLISHFSAVLGITGQRRAAIIGFGKLGGALLGYSGFPERGFEIVAVFDSDPAKIGAQAGALAVTSVDDLEDVLVREGVEIVILATPGEAAQEVADRVVSAGITAILNLAPVRLTVPEGVMVRHVCLSTDLQVLSFYLEQGGS